MKLKISLNSKKIDGPYGGGNQFGVSLENYLKSKGHEVYRDLSVKVDLILIVASESHLRITAYDLEAIRDYILMNPQTVVVQRVNSCDEQRGSDLGINRAMLEANQIADSTIFISSFVRDLFVKKGLELRKSDRVILNGANEEFFNPQSRSGWNSTQKLRLVTHHWSSNYMKGFDIYERLDQLLAIEPFKSLFEFTYIGNIPVGVEFKNTKVIGPTSGHALANLLRQNHIYLTAARNEAAGMHHVEGVRCGLPVLFLNSGALPEYCGPYGLEFTLIDFEEKLQEMAKRYAEFREKVLACPYTSTWMAAQYEDNFLQLVAERRTHPRLEPTLGKKLKMHLVTRPSRRIRKFQVLAQKAIRVLK